MIAWTDLTAQELQGASVMDARKLALLTIAAACGLVTLTGCADKLTRAHFDMVQLGQAERYDVEETLGKDHYPEVGDMWHYERVDKHLNVMIHFGEEGRVWRKEWHDTLNEVHYDSQQPDADTSTYESTEMRRIQ
jgi:acetyl-CoA acetyltransferase